MKPTYSIGQIEIESLFIKRTFSQPQNIYEADELYDSTNHLFVVNRYLDLLKIHISPKSKNCNGGHEAIVHHFSLEDVLGGGCVSVDENLRALVLDNYSGDFGAVPKVVLEEFGGLLLARFDCTNVIVNPYLPMLRANWKSLNIE